MILKGCTAIITGGSRGIGKAIALKLAGEGANIAILDMIESDVDKEISEQGQECIFIQTNVTDKDSVDKAVKQVIEKFGSIDILVNNAGITRDNLVMRMKQEEWESVINVNLTGPFNIIKSATRQMFKQRKGKIINIASVVGLMGNVGQANYSASKAGLIGLTKTLAREFSNRNIQINAVAPGFINTEMTAKLSDEIKEATVKMIPAGKYGEPEDIANAVVFLASSGANYITGQVLNVDGGILM